MFDALFHENEEEYVNWVNSAGSMIYRGNMTVQGSSSSLKDYYWEIYSIMGDPSLIPYIGIPEAQTPNFVSNLLMGSTSLNVTAAPYSYVSLTVDGVIIGTQLLGPTGSGTVNFPALSTPQAVKMVISRVDYQPYITEIPVIIADGPFLSLTSYSVNDNNNNGLLEYGETGSLNLVIENIGTSASSSGTITFSETDTYLTLMSNSASISSINADASININSVIDLSLASNVPNNHTMSLAYVISAGGEEYTGNISLTGKSYDIEITGISIDDTALGNGNSVIDAGETFDIVVVVENNGQVNSPANNITIQNSSNITYNSSSITVPIISAENSQEVRFTASASNSIPAGELVTFTVNANYPNGSAEFSQDFLVALLQIGEGTITDTHLPIEAFYGYTYSQTIYTASELNLGTSNINKVAYHYNGNSDWTDNIVIYMGNTTKDSFTSTSNWVTSTNLTQVYSGTFAVPASPGWVEIILTTPFIYDGTSNLVIAFDENTSGYHESGDEFYCYATGSDRSIYYYSDSINPDPASPVSGTVSANNPNLRIFATASTSDPEISINTTSLDFGEVIIRNSVTRDFTISNTGGAVLTGSILLPDNFTFSTRSNKKDITNLRTSSQDFSLNPGNNQTYSITFTPTVELCYNSNITINNNAGQYPEYVSLVACGIKPSYSSTTRLISKTLAPDTQDTYSLDIENTGSGDLEILLEITDSERNSGGPDNYGYTWKDSYEDGVSYDWIDISGTGTLISEGDEESDEIPLPFTFNFYGQDYTTVNVSSNGFLSFTSTATTFSNESIPNSAEPNAVIAAFWDDLKPAGDEWGNVYYQNFSTYTVIQWEDVSHYSYLSAFDNETFQIILYSNGEIKYQYKTVANATSCTVGIENQTGDDGLLLTYNNAFLESEYAIMFTSAGVTPSWLSLSNDYLIIPEVSAETITVSFDATGLELGTYHKNIYILTNDPDLEEITVPVTLIVGGSTTPDILVDTQSIDFGRVMASDFVLDTVTITNIGNEILRGSIRATNSFTITEARANISKNEIISAHQGLRRIGNFEFILANGISKSYSISHSTTLAGSYDGELIISSNDPENPEVSVPLALEVVNPPSINVNPESIGLTLLPDQTTSRDLTISNTGDLDLNCNLSLQANEERYIIEIFSANFDDNDLTDWTIDFNYNVNDTWHIAEDYDGYDLDGSSFLFIDSDEAGSNDLDDTIESPSFNISDYSEITVEFDHYFNAYGDEIADVDLWTGTEWINIGSWADDDIGYWSSPSHFIYTLTNEGYSDVKLRFHYYDANWDWYWAIDNLVVSGEGTPVPQWVTMDSVFDSFTVTPNSNQDITLNFSSIDFEVGVYFATLNIQSNSSETSSIDIPITFIINELENEPNWQPVIYPNNSATIYAEVTHLSNEISEDDIVSAWVGDECRGIGSIVLVDRSQAFTTMVIQSNGSAENICFKFYDRSEDMVIEESNATPISSGQVVGSALEPFPINIGIVELIAPNYLDVEITRNMANINWIAVPNADFYKVFYSSDSESWTELGQTVETSYQHNQPRSQAHFYKVKAIMD